MQRAILNVPVAAWTPAYDGDREVHEGAWVAGITGLLDLSGRPGRIRVIGRKERPHPGVGPPGVRNREGRQSPSRASA